MNSGLRRLFQPKDAEKIPIDPATTSSSRYSTSSLVSTSRLLVAS